jgi:putative heme-binding domain-containing protein
MKFPALFFVILLLFAVGIETVTAQETGNTATAGNFRRGRALFANRGCAACHSIDGKSTLLGPDLSKPEKPLTRAALLESINEPSKQVKAGYETYDVVLFSGITLTGRITKETDEAITLLIYENSSIQETEIDREEIEEINKQTLSMMPQGLLKDLRDSQVADLLAYVESVSNPAFVQPAVAEIPAKQPGVTLEPVEADATFYSPEESMKRIHLAPGYHLELVAAEPMIEEPVLCVWDGNSRMYVAEMRTYMQDADGTDEDLPKSRVSLLEDTDGDGRMDKVTRFVDNMVLPRMILPLDDRIIINETYTEDYYSYRDTDGDGVADEKILLYPGGSAGGNLEHQNSALTWGLDNWIYTARLGTKRHRFINGEWTSEPIYGENGQWGLAMDNVGRMFLSAAGGERSAYGFQQLPQYGQLSMPGELEPEFETVYPIVKMDDVQGGLGRVDKKRGALNHMTGCAGQSIFRGDRLTDDLVGDYIIPEPVGRLVRRAKVTQIDGKYVLSNAYEQSEFIASTDKNFRPLGSATGPDGCLYIVDMYRGIIQEGNWTRKGSYLREVIDRDGFAKNIGRGRIYRVVHDSTVKDTPPRMLDEKTADLVKHLAHPNGWWRDTAQKLIVLRGDKSVVPALEKLARESDSALGRMHALWTLDGLNATSKPIVVAALQDPEPQVKLAAIRLSESFLADDPELTERVAEAGFDADMTVVVQAINSLRFADAEIGHSLISEIAAAYSDNDMVLASSQTSLRYRAGEGGPTFANFDAATLEKMKQGYQTYTLVCIRCHGPDGKGAVSSDGLQLAPSLANSPRLLASADVPARILLHGLSGPIEGKTYPGLMESMKREDDKWIASALTYVRNSFGNAAPAVDEKDVARIRKATALRVEPYKIDDFAAYLRVPPETVRTWKLSASTGKRNVTNTVDGDLETRFDTAGEQQPGQWFQFDTGQQYELTSLVLDATGSNSDFPRQYIVRVSDDGESWSEPVASGNGVQAVTTISIDPGTVGRFVRIIQTGTQQGKYWSIHELAVYGRVATADSNDQSLASDEQTAQLDANLLAQLRHGQAIYAQSCLRCHGRNGAGRVDSADKPLGASINKTSDALRNTEALIRITLRGLATDDAKVTCPALAESRSQEIATDAADVLTYIRTRFHEGLTGIERTQVESVLGQISNTHGSFTRKSLSNFLPISREVMKSWKLTASHGADSVDAAIDGNPKSRYTTGEFMKPGMWFTFDMRKTYLISSIILDSSASSGDYPRGYAVTTSDDGEQWSQPIAEGKGTTAITEIALRQGTRCRFIRIEQTGKHSLFWSIHELQVYGSPVE